MIALVSSNRFVDWIGGDGVTRRQRIGRDTGRAEMYAFIRNGEFYVLGRSIKYHRLYVYEGDTIHEVLCNGSRVRIGGDPCDIGGLQHRWESIDNDTYLLYPRYGTVAMRLKFNCWPGVVWSAECIDWHRMLYDGNGWWQWLATSGSKLRFTYTNPAYNFHIVKGCDSQSLFVLDARYGLVMIYDCSLSSLVVYSGLKKIKIWAYPVAWTGFQDIPKCMFASDNVVFLRCLCDDPHLYRYIFINMADNTEYEMLI